MMMIIEQLDACVPMLTGIVRSVVIRLNYVTQAYSVFSTHEETLAVVVGGEKQVNSEYTTLMIRVSCACTSWCYRL